MRFPFSALYPEFRNAVHQLRRKGYHGEMNKPGQIVDRSGIYKTVGDREAALSKGDRFPPTVAGGGWAPVHLTKTAPRKPPTARAKRK
jgi:hypothetical protein